MNDTLSVVGTPGAAASALPNTATASWKRVARLVHGEFAQRRTRADDGRPLSSQHACRKGAEPSHKSKMEDLTVEVCGENGAYYKVRSVKSIEKSGRSPRAEDRTSREPRRGRNLAMREPVLRDGTALKCSLEVTRLPSTPCLSHLTGRDFPSARAVTPSPRRPRSLRRQLASGLGCLAADTPVFAIRAPTRQRSCLPSPALVISFHLFTRLAPSRSDESRFSLVDGVDWPALLATRYSLLGTRYSLLATRY